MNDPSYPKPWLGRITALFEVITVLLVGTVVARLISGAINLAGSKDQMAQVGENVPPDFLTMAWVTALDLLIKYGVLLGLAFLIGRWHRKRPFRKYGLGLGGNKVSGLIKAGVVVFALGYFLPSLLQLLDRHVVSLGAGASHWELLEGQTSWQFWVFMAVSSFLLVPVLEELFTRGYMQTRLTEDFGIGSAVLIVGVIFAFSHTQYYGFSVLRIGMLTSIILSSIFMGYVFFRTGSLIPVIVAHALVNIPYQGKAEIVVFAAVILIIVVARKSILKYARSFLVELRSMQPKGIILLILFLIAAFFIVLLTYARPYLLYLGILLIAATITLLILDKKQNIRVGPRI